MVSDYIEFIDAVRLHGDVHRDWHPVIIAIPSKKEVLGQLLFTMEELGCGVFTLDATPDSVVIYFQDQTDQMSALLRFSGEL